MVNTHQIKSELFILILYKHNINILYGFFLKFSVQMESN
jgi:hypothetical protein